MGWSLGYDSKWKRDIGYGVPCKCDHPGCDKIIDRGLAFVCSNQSPYGGEEGCGLYFCFDHANMEHKCDRCVAGKEPYEAKGDIAEWIRFKLRDKSWAEWRKENKEEVKAMRKRLAELEVEDGKGEG
jgi:hypothetical protein